MQINTPNFATSPPNRYLYIEHLFPIDAPSCRGIPIALETWSVNDKCTWLHNEVAAFLKEVFQKSEIPDCIVQLDEHTKRGFACHHEGCNVTFPLHSTRVR